MLDIIGVLILFFDNPEVQGYRLPDLSKKKWGYGKLDIKNNKIALLFLCSGPQKLDSTLR